MNKISAVR